ncbi:HET-domain-containing protein [Apiospora saccharicola]
MDVELPSWVARASRAPFSLDNHPGMRVMRMGRANADPLVGPPTDGHRNYSAAQTRHVNLDVLKFRRRPELGHYSMYVQGFELDEVAEVVDASQGGSIPVSWLELGGWEWPYEEDPPDDLWRTLVADRGRDNRNPPCRESVHKGNIGSGRVKTGALINNERNSIVTEFCRRVHAVIWNRRMFKTKGERLGLAYDVEKGDKVCVLYGCTVPVVLQQTPKTRQEDAKDGDGDLEKETLEDAKEALKTCIRQCEKNRELKRKRKFRNEKNKKKWIESGEWYEMMDAKKKAEDQLERERERKKEEEMREKGGKDEIPDDSVLKELPVESSVTESIPGRILPTIDERPEFVPPDRETPKTSYQEKVEQAKQEDPYRFYRLRGDCYLHGMMDGEAVRHKFYEELPDRVFELR